MSDATYSMNDLSASACYALCYAQAIVYGKNSPHGVRFELAQKHVANGMSTADMRMALAKGLAELRDMGIIECKRDGEGDLVPTVLHEERIRAADARLVTRDLT